MPARGPHSRPAFSLPEPITASAYIPHVHFFASQRPVASKVYRAIKAKYEGRGA